MIVHDLSIEDYHASPAISKSGLDDIARCPAAYYALHLDPDRPAEEPHDPHGALAHCAILEPESFADRYVVGPDVNRNTKVWHAFVDANPSKLAIKPDEYHAAMAQAIAVRRIPDVAELLSAGRAEVSAFWTDEATGEACRCRPDWVHPVGNDAVILADVKTFGNASPQEFQRQAARMRYHVQDAWYTDGYALASGLRVLAFVFIAVETSWPFLASATMLDEEGRDAGRTLYRRDLDTFHACRAANDWPAHGTEIHTISLPYWALQEAA